MKNKVPGVPAHWVREVEGEARPRHSCRCTPRPPQARWLTSPSTHAQACWCALFIRLSHWPQLFTYVCLVWDLIYWSILTLYLRGPWRHITEWRTGSQQSVSRSVNSRSAKLLSLLLSVPGAHAMCPSRWQWRPWTVNREPWTVASGLECTRKCPPDTWIRSSIVDSTTRELYPSKTTD